MAKNIDALWYGNLEPAKKSGQNDPAIKQLEDLIKRNGEMLDESLNEKEKDRLTIYNDCVDEYILLTNKHAFCDGFCLAMKIAAEALICTDEAEG